MLSYEDALQELLSKVPAPRRVRVPLPEALGRVLAEAVLADQDLPPFRKSFVDGFAVRSEDTQKAPVALSLAGEVAAGAGHQPAILPGQAVRVMTGAPVPPDADAVQMVERTRLLGKDRVECLEPVEPGENVAPQGNEVLCGQTVLAPGRVLGGAELGVLATVGCEEVPIYKPVRAAILPTGNELVEVGVQPEFGQIRNSNAYTLAAQFRRLGVESHIFPVVPDDPEATRQAVSEGLRMDVVVLTGGVSMGEYDYVHQVLAEAGVDIFFHKAAIKPGKPLLAGGQAERLVFGLPGNPVSAFVTFELFVRPAVRRWMGFESESLLRVSGRLTAEVRQKPGRKFFKPARTFWESEGFRVEPIETRGSADLVGFSPANSLLVVESDVRTLEAGSQVEVFLLADFLEKGS